MRSIIPLSLALALVGVASPALAACDSVEETGTYYCIDESGDFPSNAFVSQDGVARASYSSYEYTFFGSTYEGRDLWVSTHPASPVGSNDVGYYYWCMDAGSDGMCEYEESVVFVYAPGTFAGSVSATTTFEGTVVCVTSKATPSVCSPVL